MFMNQQSVSIQATDYFVNHLKKITGEKQVLVHATNVYLFHLPPAGEQQTLTLTQKEFIFKEELSLYEEQFQFHLAFSETLFTQFFQIHWHGVNYHIDIDKLT